jgi:hypothetical protein
MDGSNNIFYSNAGAAESEIGPATFFAATGASPRAECVQQYFLQQRGQRPGRRDGAEGAGNRSSNIFRITVAGQRDRGEKELNRSNTGSGGHCPTGTVTPI